MTESIAIESTSPGSQKPELTGDKSGEPVAYSLVNHVAYLTMQLRPHNYLGVALLNGLIDGARRAADEGARSVVVRSGLRNFCAGADVALFDTAYENKAPEVDPAVLLTVFDELPIPIVASIQGVCVGGGFEIALACDLLIASESARIGSVEATIGVNPLMGAMQRVTQRAGATRAKEMALLARRYDAATLERWNLINRVVPDDQLDRGHPHDRRGAGERTDRRARLLEERSSPSRPRQACGRPTGGCWSSRSRSGAPRTSVPDWSR